MAQLSGNEVSHTAILAQITKAAGHETPDTLWHYINVAERLRLQRQPGGNVPDLAGREKALNARILFLQEEIKAQQARLDNLYLDELAGKR